MQRRQCAIDRPTFEHKFDDQHDKRAKAEAGEGPGNHRGRGRHERSAAFRRTIQHSEAAPMTPDEYDGWYRTPRGSWIGETEYRLLCELLAPRPGETLIDVGCGTGYFTRRFALAGSVATGVDQDAQMLEFARANAAGAEPYLQADACRLPFRDGAFDLCISVTALCFIQQQSQALAEVLRVTRRRFAIGLLNRRSLLCLQKGRHGGSGAYRGARWHTAAEAKALLAGTTAGNVRLKTAVFLPCGTASARLIEQGLPGQLPLGAFLVVAGDKLDQHSAPSMSPA
ncbi:MAG TPA: methyltransferase domain-containing protein [Burkholderiaceae bacterium]|nr:methyltransferase domain-containing protein [Burkholderiaceae bacterium]